MLSQFHKNCQQNFGPNSDKMWHHFWNTKLTHHVFTNKTHTSPPSVIHKSISTLIIFIKHTMLDLTTIHFEEHFVFEVFKNLQKTLQINPTTPHPSLTPSVGYPRDRMTLGNMNIISNWPNSWCCKNEVGRCALSEDVEIEKKQHWPFDNKKCHFKSLCFTNCYTSLWTTHHKTCLPRTHNVFWDKSVLHGPLYVKGDISCQTM